MHFVVLIVLLVLFVAGYLGFCSYVAKASVSTAPRDDMFLCEKHGPIAKRHLFQLSGYTEKPISMCPICYDDKMKAAKKA